MNGIGANQQWPFVAFSMQDNLFVIGFSRKNTQGICNHRIQVGLLLNLGSLLCLSNFPNCLMTAAAWSLARPNVDHGFLYLPKF